MAINIPSLFSDIIGTDEQRRLQMLQEGDLLARQLTGNLRTGAGASLGQRLTATAAPTVTAIASQLPQRRENIRRAAGGMLGLDVRTEGEKVADVLGEGFETDAEGLRDLSRRLVRIAPVQAAGLMQAADERDLLDLNRTKIEGDIERQNIETQMQASYRIFAADQMNKNPDYKKFAEPTAKGVLPMTRVEAIMEEMMPDDPKPLTGVVIIDGAKRFDALGDGLGNYFTPDGKTQLQVSDNARIFNRPTITSDIGDIRDLTDQEQEINDIRFQTKNFRDTVERAVEFYENNPNANTATAGISAIFGTLEQNLDALGELAEDFYGSAPEQIRQAAAGLDGFTSTGDKRGLLNYLSSLGITNAEAQSVALNVALQYAAATGLGSGRSLTDKDLALALDAVGVGRQNKDQIVAGLKRSLMNVLGSYNTLNNTLAPEQQEEIKNPFTETAAAQLDELF